MNDKKQQDLDANTEADNTKSETEQAQAATSAPSTTTEPQRQEASQLPESTLQTEEADEVEVADTSTASTAATSTIRYASSWRVRLSILLVLLLALVSIGASYFLFTQLQQQALATAKINTQFTQALVRPKQQIVELEKRQLRASALTNKVTELSNGQALMRKKIATLSQRNPNHWLATEADYLVRMAGRKLWLENDPQTAAELLQAADNRIASMQEPGLTTLRRELARDIATVAAIKSTDVAGTVFSIDEIIRRLETLPLVRNEALAEQAKVDNDDLTQSIADWRSNLTKTWKALTEDFITVRHRTTDLAPLLAPNQEWYLIENIRNKLLQSQLALYQFDEVNYRQSLKMARTWIYQYFDIDATQTQDTLAALDALATLKVTTIAIDKFESTAKLKQLITFGNISTATMEDTQ